MRLSCSVYGVVDTAHPKQGIRDLKKAGFNAALLDFNMFGFSDDTLKNDYSVEDMDKYYLVVRKEAESTGLEFPIAKVQELNRFKIFSGNHCLENSSKEACYNLLLETTKRAIHACESMGCSYLIVPPLWYTVKNEQAWDINKLFYIELAKECKKANTKLLLTNLTRYVNGHYIRGICSDVSTASRWIDLLNKEVGADRFGFCLDVGNCNLCGQDIYEMVTGLKSHLCAVVLKDNFSINDAALLPFSASNNGHPTTDWLGIIRALREQEFDGHLVLEITDSIRAISPILHPALLSYAKSIGDYFVWQIGIESALKKYSTILLFGAGNMCRNFMRLYGDKYHPQFTCDNNSALWHTEFEGLVVKPPDALRGISPDCGVFICNIYYREIEAQLRELGVQNIEYFNDEYM